MTWHDFNRYASNEKATPMKTHKVVYCCFFRFLSSTLLLYLYIFFNFLFSVFIRFNFYEIPLWGILYAGTLIQILGLVQIINESKAASLSRNELYFFFQLSWSILPSYHQQLGNLQKINVSAVYEFNEMCGNTLNFLGIVCWFYFCTLADASKLS